MLGFIAEMLKFPGPALNTLNSDRRVLIQNEHSQYVIMFAHGNRENISLSIREMTPLFHHVSVCFYEYPGYNDGAGSSETQVNQAALDCLEWLMYVKEYKTCNIILMGRSIGSGPTLWLASNTKRRFGGIILWSAFTSIADLGHSLFQVSWECEDVPTWIKCFVNPFTAYIATSWCVIGRHYDNVAAIAKIHPGTCIHFIHGAKDDIIPVHYVNTLKKATIGSNVSEHIQPYSTHNAFNMNDLFFSILDFLNKINEGEEKRIKTQ